MIKKVSKMSKNAPESGRLGMHVKIRGEIDVFWGQKWSKNVKKWSKMVKKHQKIDKNDQK